METMSKMMIISPVITKTWPKKSPESTKAAEKGEP